MKVHFQRVNIRDQQGRIQQYNGCIKNLLFSTEYLNSDKDKRGLHNAYLTTRKSLNLIGLSVDDMSSLSKDYMGKNVDIAEKLYDVWELLKKERMGIFWWFK